MNKQDFKKWLKTRWKFDLDFEQKEREYGRDVFQQDNVDEWGYFVIRFINGTVDDFGESWEIKIGTL